MHPSDSQELPARDARGGTSEEVELDTQDRDHWIDVAVPWTGHWRTAWTEEAILQLLLLGDRACSPDFADYSLHIGQKTPTLGSIVTLVAAI